jgi:beta-lactamase superfamily II metal-dependent hydrolase
MPLVKSLSVGNGDMFYIRHGSDNFTIIDCCIPEDRHEAIISELRERSYGKSIRRVISTHPDEDHVSGLEYLRDEFGIENFYCVENQASKTPASVSFTTYCELRDSDKAYYIEKGCTRRWMNIGDDERATAGINILWPKVDNADYQHALDDAAKGVAFNNMCPVVRYATGDASFMWIGDLETQFMENVLPDISLRKTTIVFAPHHGRHTGKIPHSWLKILDPQIIVIGEAPSRHLNYYTGYEVITQNSAGDITFDTDGEKVHIYSSNKNYTKTGLSNEGEAKFDYYIGSITVETKYTL